MHAMYTPAVRVLAHAQAAQMQPVVKICRFVLCDGTSDTVTDVPSLREVEASSMGEGSNVSTDVAWCGPPGHTHEGIDTFDLVFGNNFVLSTFLRMHMQRTNCTVNF